MALLLAGVILTIYLFHNTTPQQESAGIGRSASAYITVAAFLLGVVCSSLAGYVGMWVSLFGFSAMVVVGMAIIGVTILYATFYVLLGVESPNAMKVNDLPLLLVGYSFGASFVAQLGSGIFIKVGDNVGDCAARGAHLFESITAEIINAMILGGTMAKRCKLEDKHVVAQRLLLVGRGLMVPSRLIFVFDYAMLAYYCRIWEICYYNRPILDRSTCSFVEKKSEFKKVVDVLESLPVIISEVKVKGIWSCRSRRVINADIELGRFKGDAKGDAPEVPKVSSGTEVVDDVVMMETDGLRPRELA
ncbi:hypothetical protein GIB67_034262 [Kingdonia uniflora]|uniref:H(+)-exporting diphosphatase n=1 Tax=Kingdonia uniflora TaxID=39325 RepID=A0A7J7NS44_9MAGN|nr:hypothetical protein GIB67_034262 [Kingdonia uniflora]